MHWVVTALCADPAIELSANDDTLCIKSFDFNGSGIVNFLDTFQLVQEVAPGTGYSADFRACSAGNIVNFLDTFVYVPHLSGGHACPGSTSFLLTKVIDGLLPDCDELF
jgi:hypothetical protein